MKVSFAAPALGLLQLAKLVKSQTIDEICAAEAGWVNQSDIVFDGTMDDLVVENDSGRWFHCGPTDDVIDLGSDLSGSKCIQMGFSFPGANGVPERTLLIDSCPNPGAGPPRLDFYDLPNNVSPAPPAWLVAHYTLGLKHNFLPFPIGEQSTNAPLTAQDFEWLESLKCQLRENNDNRGENNCNSYCGFQALRVIELLNEWPAAMLPYNYRMNAAAEKDHQEAARLILENGVSTTLPTFPGAVPGTYTPLCPHLGDYLEDPYTGASSDPSLYWGKLELNPATCPAGQMKELGSPCASYPLDPLTFPNFARFEGDCFGRCGIGCNGLANSQFTLDCADFDFCYRLSEQRDPSDGVDSCTAEWMHAIDDRMWAPNCQDRQEMPCNAACESMDPEPPIPFNPINAVVLPVGSSSNCDLACSLTAGTFVINLQIFEVEAGQMACDPNALLLQNTAFVPEQIAGSMNFLGYTCEPDTGFETPLDGIQPATDGATVPMIYDPDMDSSGPCFPSTAGRAVSTFDCSANPPAGYTRICSCYLQGR